MDAIADRIREIEHQIALSYQDMRSFSKDLACLAMEHKEALDILIGTALLSQMEAKYGIFLSLQEKEDNDEKQKDLASRGLVKKSAYASRLQSLEREYLSILERLGALMVEQGHAGVLPAKLDAVVNPLLEKEALLVRKAAAPGIAGVLGRTAMKRFKAGAREDFIALSKSAEEKKLLDYLSQGQSEALLASYHENRKENAKVLQKFDNIQKHLEERGIGNGKAETAISSQLSDARDAYNEAAIAYGAYLFENGSKWLSEKIPDQMLDLIDNMLKVQKYIESEKKEIEHLKNQIQIDEYRSLIGKDQEAIARLEGERKSLKAQIDEIALHIDALNAKIKKIEEES